MLFLLHYQALTFSPFCAILTGQRVLQLSPQALPLVMCQIISGFFYCLEGIPCDDDRKYNTDQVNNHLHSGLTSFPPALRLSFRWRCPLPRPGGFPPDSLHYIMGLYRCQPPFYIFLKKLFLRLKPHAVYR